MTIIFFETKNSAGLNPITLTRPAFDMLCGGITLIDLAKKIFNQTAARYIVREYLMPISKKRYGWSTKLEKDILFLNSALAPSAGFFAELKQIISAKKSFQLTSQNRIIALYLNSKPLSPAVFKSLSQENIEKFLAGFKLKSKKINWPFFDYPHQVIGLNQKILKENLNFLSCYYQEIEPKVYAGSRVKISGRTVFNVEAGPIIIDSGTAVLPFTYLVGPLYIGPGCIVKEFSTIRGSSIGRVCKIGGEVVNSVISGYSNKQHYGFLGESYVGQWVNLAAGTTNSDLKNTYSEITMAGQRTGTNFLGCVIGDNCKTAINVAVYTGKIIGVNSFIYSRVAEDVNSFVNFNKPWNQVEFGLVEAIKCQKAMMARRGIRQTKYDIKLLSDVFELTKPGRKEASIAKGRFIM